MYSSLIGITFALSVVIFSLGEIKGVEAQASLQAWIFPGGPTCGARDTYHANPIDTLKPQYFNVNNDGSLSVGPTDTCNGFTSSNVADVKAYSRQQFATTACQYTGFSALIHNQTNVDAAINTFLTTMQQTNMTGVEIDCENYENWTADDATAFKQFLTALGNTLHANGFQLMIDGPAIDTSDTQAGVANFKYEDYETLSAVDYVCVMAYDNQLGSSTGQAVAPDDWQVKVINWLKTRISNINRIVVGTASYGYHGQTGQGNTGQIQDTKQQAQTYPGYATATRDPNSQEMMWTDNGIFYDYSDTVTLDHRRALIEGLGIKYISVWHLGGNDWFSSNSSSVSPSSSPSSSPTSSPTSSPSRAPSTTSGNDNVANGKTTAASTKLGASILSCFFVLLIACTFF